MRAIRLMLTAGSLTQYTPPALGCHTDAFTGANGTALTTYSTSWRLNSGNFAINTNALASNTAATETGAHFQAADFSANQSAEATYAAETAAGSAIGVAVRCAMDGTANYYGLYSDTAEAFTFKVVGGTWTQIGSTHASAAIGNLLYIEIQGSTLISRINGVEQTNSSQTDLTTGKPGVSGFNNNTGARIDDWEGCSI